MSKNLFNSMGEVTQREPDVYTASHLRQLRIAFSIRRVRKWIKVPQEKDEKQNCRSWQAARAQIRDVKADLLSCAEIDNVWFQLEKDIKMNTNVSLTLQNINFFNVRKENQFKV